MSTISGVPLQPPWLVPSITSASVMVGSALPILIVCTPPAPIENRIWSGAPETLAVLLAAVMASRSEMLPSAPMFDRSAPIEVTFPSTTSAVVVTVTGPKTTS